MLYVRILFLALPQQPTQNEEEVKRKGMLCIYFNQHFTEYLLNLLISTLLCWPCYIIPLSLVF